jgi:hypothetical protein
MAQSHLYSRQTLPDKACASVVVIRSISSNCTAPDTNHPAHPIARSHPQLQADSEPEEELVGDADDETAGDRGVDDEAAGDRGADDSRGYDAEQQDGDLQDGNADQDGAEQQAADGEDAQQDAAADGAANGAAGDRKRSRSRSRERQVRDGSQDKRRWVVSCSSNDTCALDSATQQLQGLFA